MRYAFGLLLCVVGVFLLGKLSFIPFPNRAEPTLVWDLSQSRDKSKVGWPARRAKDNFYITPSTAM